ncbi:hypothetical protein QQ045_018710 [Rhodiola kirilowii]
MEATGISRKNQHMFTVHSNVCLAIVVVTQTLDWKLHAFDVLSEFDGNAAASNGPMLQYEWLIGAQYKPQELLKSDWAAIRQSPQWSIDSWGMGETIGSSSADPVAMMGDYIPPEELENFMSACNDAAVQKQ